MNTIQKSIRRPLKSVSLMYWLNLPTEKTGEKNKQWNEGNNRKKLIVYETKQGELLLIEGYEKYFYLLKKNPYTIATFMIGDFESNLEARYAAVRELFTYQHSAWVTKMQQIRILHYTFKQEKKFSFFQIRNSPKNQWNNT
ncbi:MAG: hypothetical protein LRY73_02650 [Bacillus sp. (in: Bacteria)]|nr:hypothetical protein [Bacillus sp. (in: firmicutes)]